MAAKEKLTIPNEVVEADWTDDIDVGYATYGNRKQEMEYISPTDISEKTKNNIEKLKAKKIGKNILTIFTKNDKIAA